MYCGIVFLCSVSKFDAVNLWREFFGLPQPDSRLSMSYVWSMSIILSPRQFDLYMSLPVGGAKFRPYLVGWRSR
jgi:hypothetical protein